MPKAAFEVGIIVVFLSETSGRDDARVIVAARIQLPVVIRTWYCVIYKLLRYFSCGGFGGR